MTLHKSSTRLIQPDNIMLRSGFIGGGANAATDELLKSFQAVTATQTKGEAYLTSSEAAPLGKQQIQVEEKDKNRVGLFTLLKYSTTNERYLMVVGIIMAAISGLCMPVWLLLLAQSLSTFNQIGQLFATLGEEAIGVLLDELYKLIYSFAIVGGVTLFSGTIYVSLWTYVGEAQSLRIRKSFVKSALNQNMGWFDTHLSGGDPQELSSLASNSIMRIEMSLKRSIPDTLANLLASVGSLIVAIGLDPPLALFMLAALPIIGICVGVLSCFMRKYSGQALGELSSAGSFASEVLTGIKTIASLRAEGWATGRYTGNVKQAQKYSVLTIFCGKMASGLMGLLFYLIYCFAFAFGTTQAAENIDTRNEYISPFACWGITIRGHSRHIDCGITGSEVMVCIYGVILCAQFFALMSKSSLSPCKSTSIKRISVTHPLILLSIFLHQIPGSMPSTWVELLLLKYTEQLNVLLPLMDATILRVQSLERIFRRISSSEMLYLLTPLGLMMLSLATSIFRSKLDLR